ncbi:MAG TPA: hypothetical protein VGC67_17585 [Cellulomonas sp.]
MADTDGWRLEVPSSFDLAWTVLVAGGALLLLAALVVWGVRGREPGGTLTELLLIVLVPVLGPAGYLLGELVRRGRRPARGALAAGSADPRR